MFRYSHSVFVVAIALLLCSVFSQCPQGTAQLPTGSCGEVDYIEGCIAYSAKSKCSTCQFNYDLVGDLCEYNPKEQNRCCASFGSNGECSQCKAGLFLQDGTCKQATIVGCITKNGDSCVNCAYDYYLQNGRCAKGVKGCVSYNTNGNCLTCNGDSKLQNGVCVKTIIQGCQTQVSSSVCSQCFPPFVLNNSLCSVPDCARTDDYGCVECNSGFSLKNRSCVIRFKGCQVDSQRACVYCKQGFSLVNGQCVSDACSQTNGSGDCISCKSPYSLNSNARCIINNCLIQRNNSCVSCIKGFRLSQGQCLAAASDIEVCRTCAAQFFLGLDRKCNPYQSGCEQYANGVCSSCRAPFELIDNNCVIDGCSTANNEGCSVCNPPYILDTSSKFCRLKFCLKAKGGKCSSCQTGYTPNANGVCVISDQNCLEVDTFGICTKCADGFHPETTGCVANLVGCVYSGSVCSSCKSPFQLSNNKCEITGCLAYNAAGCTSCNTDLYYLNGNTCAQKNPGCIYEDGICVRCIKGFNWSNNRCAIEGCQAYLSSPTGGCSSCISPYILSGGLCAISNCIKSSSLKCISCQTGYAISSIGSCLKTIDNCEQYDADKCKVCKVGFYLSASGLDCLVAVPGCVYLNGQCTSCTNNYTFKNKRCFETDVNCLQIDDSGICINCRQGYYFEKANGKCKMGDTNCEILNADGTCKQCKPRFYINPTAGCVSALPGCIYTNGKCQSCISPFMFSSGICIIPGCDKLSYDGCLGCTSPFYLSNQICKLRNCLQLDGTRCTKCESSYIMIGGQCFVNDGSCTSWTPEGICKQCKKGYVLIDDKCQFVDDNCISFTAVGVCQSCDSAYFLTPDGKCRSKAIGCDVYRNGICSSCIAKYFLWQGICFPYMEGCLNVIGKSCVSCEAGYDLHQGICVKKGKSINFSVIDNNSFKYKLTSGQTPSTVIFRRLSKASALPTAQLQYSSVFSNRYFQYQIQGNKISPFGWRASTNTSGDWVGLKLPKPLTIVKVEIQSGDMSAYVTRFTIAYRSSPTDNFTEIPTVFDSSAIANGRPLSIDLPVPVVAVNIRIKVKSYVIWPAARFDFIYEDKDAMDQWKGIRNIDQIDKKISAIATDRLDILIERNSRYFLVPKTSSVCQKNKANCYGKIVFCAPKNVNSVSSTVTKGTARSIIVQYSLDGLTFRCYNGCRPISTGITSPFDPVFRAKEIRITLGQGSFTSDAQLNFGFDAKDA